MESLHFRDEITTIIKSVLQSSSTSDPVTVNDILGTEREIGRFNIVYMMGKTARENGVWWTLDDPSLMMCILKKLPTFMQYATPELKADKDICLAVVRVDGTMLEFLSDSLRDDEDVVLAAVLEYIRYHKKKDQIKTGPLQWASVRLQNDHAFLAKALGRAQLTHEMFKVFGKVFLRAEQWPNFLLSTEREVVTQFDPNMGFLNRSAYHRGPSFHIWADPVAVMGRVKITPHDIQWASQELREDKEIVLEAVQREGTALQFLGGLRNDEDVVLAALLANSENKHFCPIQWASDSLRRDPDFMRRAKQIDRRAQYTAYSIVY